MEKLSTSPTTNISAELACLMRGFFATPVISALSRLGALDVMQAKPDFKTTDFPFISDLNLLHNTFKYLTRIGLLCDNDGTWGLTEIGKLVFQRASSFYVPHSYAEYMDLFYASLIGKEIRKPTVERTENILGSGKTHLRYFPFATSFLKRRTSFDVILDIGCGDGKFLGTVLKTTPGKVALGVDFSEVSVETTRSRLRKEHSSAEIDIFCSDAFKTEVWGKEVKRIAGTKSIAISMWFLIHEISANDPEKIRIFLKNIHDLFPESPLIICEIVRHEDEILAANRHDSIMPEYLFFHDISSQGVLSWQEYNQIIKDSPYEIHTERLFDEIPDLAGNLVPSSFIWCLMPKNK